MNDFSNRSSSKGFTLIELMVVISIIGVLSSVTLASLSSARTKARDAQVKLQVKTIINALYLARDESTGQFPGSNGVWQCLKPSGTCWLNSYAGNTTITNALAPYLSTIPTPPLGTFNSSTYLYDAYLYLPNYPGPIGNSPPGTYLIWAQSVPIINCQGHYGGNYDGNYYCYQLVAPL